MITKIKLAGDFVYCQNTSENGQFQLHLIFRIRITNYKMQKIQHNIFNQQHKQFKQLEMPKTFFFLFLRILLVLDCTNVILDLYQDTDNFNKIFPISNSLLEGSLSDEQRIKARVKVEMMKLCSRMYLKNNKRKLLLYFILAERPGFAQQFFEKKISLI